MLEAGHIAGVSKTRYAPATRTGKAWEVRTAFLLIVVAAIAALGRQLSASSSTERHGARGVPLPSTIWPASGQAAVQVGESPIKAGPNQHAAPIASVAKVMTAYLVLRDHPLRIGEDGPTISRSPTTMSPTRNADAGRGVDRPDRRG